ncbi:hypothetical protein FF38_09738 [Lucilia cuprina]|uniref:Uncharacterized protein n=1 Tax=Lucilia cuprina TaxID=7375 RepID=A0A0L0CDB6_LUCCU|nr:hypothetical protein FF38_09738 [Lucilia cuprina]
MFHPTKPHLYVASQRYIRIYDLLSQSLIKKLLPGVKWLSSFDIHPMGDNVVAGSYDQRVVWHDMDLSDRPYKTLRYHERAVRDVKFHKKLPLFCSASDDGAINVLHATVYDDVAKNPMLVPLKILKECEANSDIKHIYLMLGVPIAYPRMVWAENVMSSKLIKPVKWLSKKQIILKGLVNPFDGEVELLDDLNDHWTAKDHKHERNEFLSRLMKFQAEHKVRITVLTGDVHLCSVGVFRSISKPSPEQDSNFIVSPVSSAIVNTPPPSNLADFMNKRNKTHVFRGSVLERNIPIFNKDTTGNELNNKTCLPRRNYLILDPTLNCDQQKTYAGPEFDEDHQSAPPKHALETMANDNAVLMTINVESDPNQDDDLKFQFQFVTNMAPPLKIKPTAEIRDEKSTGFRPLVSKKYVLPPKPKPGRKRKLTNDIHENHDNHDHQIDEDSCGLCSKDDCMCAAIGIKSKNSIQKLETILQDQTYKPAVPLIRPTKEPRLKSDFTRDKNLEISMNVEVNDNERCGFCTYDTPCMCRDEINENNGSVDKHSPPPVDECTNCQDALSTLFCVSLFAAKPLAANSVSIPHELAYKILLKHHKFKECDLGVLVSKLEVDSRRNIGVQSINQAIHDLGS